jgi:hypothetical protein
MNGISLKSSSLVKHATRAGYDLIMIAQPLYSYGQAEGDGLVLDAIKANRECKGQRQEFVACHASVANKYVTPDNCGSKAIALLTCFSESRARYSPDQLKARSQALDALGRGLYAGELVEAMLAQK